VTPTSEPTASPTFNPTVLDLNSASKSSSLLYQSKTIQDGSLTGDCNSWSTYIQSLYKVRQDLFSIEIASSLNLFNATSAHAACSDPDSAKEIVQSLNNATSVVRSVTCDRNLWIIQKCSNSYSALCLNCVQPCSSASDQTVPYVVSCEHTMNYRYTSIKTSYLNSAPGLVIHDFHIIGTGVRRTLLFDSRLNDASADFKSTALAYEVVYDNISISHVSVVINASASAPGIIRCAAFDREIFDGLSTVQYIDVKRSGVFFAEAQQYNRIIMSGLLYSRVYNIYCYSTDLDGTQMDTENAMKSHFTVVTPCCATVYVDINKKVLYKSIGELHLITISLDSAPIHDATIRVSLLVSGGSSSLSTVYSESVTLSSVKQYITFMTVPAYIFDGQEANFTVVEAQIESVEQFKVLYRGGFEYGIDARKVLLLDTGCQAPIPGILSTNVVSDGRSIEILFSDETDQALMTTSYFTCSDIFDFSGAERTKCKWLTDTKIIIEVESNSALFIGSEVTLLGDRIKHKCPSDIYDCSGWNSIHPTVLTINCAVSTAVMHPKVIISGPSTISVDDGLHFSVSYSTGSGSGQWKSVDYEVYAVKRNIGHIVQHLSIASSNRDLEIKLPPSLLKTGDRFSFIVTMCNFANYCDVGLHIVTVSQSSVIIMGPKFRTTKSSVDLTLFSENFWEISSEKHFFYKWNILKNGVVVSSSKTNDEFANNDYFHIPPYTLLSSNVYEIELVASIPRSSVNIRDQIIVFVKAGNLVALIDGGDCQTIVAGNFLTLDGSNSFDEDFDRSPIVGDAFVGKGAGLSFEWSCNQVLPFIDSSCGLQVLSSNNSDKVLLYASEMSEGYLSRVFLTLFSADRSASSYVSVLVVDDKAPSISITNMQRILNPYTYAIVESIEEDLTLYGTIVSNFYDGSAHWSVNDSSIQLSDLSLTSLTTVFKSSSVSSYSHPVHLVLKARSLPSGVALKFTLTCSFGSSKELSSSIVVVLNSNPRAGHLTVDPPAGQSFIDYFSFQADYWVDDDLPLTYIFGFNTSESLNLVIQSRSEQPNAKTFLPPGPSGTVTCRVSVFDCYLSSVSSTVDVIVSLPVGYGAISNVIEDFVRLGDAGTTSYLQLLSVASSTLNFVDCEFAPDCEILRREDCRYTKNTCGSCKQDASIGILGDSNTMCYASNELAHRPLFCSSDLSCLPWEHCDLELGVCTISKKECKSSCSFNGVCESYDQFSMTTIDLCLFNDPTCKVRCSCNSGWDGDICGFPQKELESRRYQRDSLTQIVSEAGGSVYDDASLAALVNIVFSISLKPDELYIDTIYNLSTITSNMIAKYSSISSLLTLDTFEPILGVIDGIIESRADNIILQDSSDPLNTALFDSIRTNLIIISQAILRNMVPMQSNSNVIKSHLRSTFINQVTARNRFDTSCPAIPWDHLLALSTPSLQFINLKRDQYELVMSISCINDQIFKSHDKDSILAHSVLVNFDDRTDCRLNECIILVNFTHKAIIYESNQVVVSPPPVYCDLNQEPTFHTFDCGNGYTLTTECDGDFQGYINSTCPYDVQVPSCASFHNYPVLIDQVCSVHSFGASWLTCECGIFVGNSSTSSDKPISGSYLEVAPITKLLHIESIKNYTQNLYPSTISNVNDAYPVISFGIKATVTFSMMSYGSAVLTKHDTDNLIHVTSAVFGAKVADIIVAEVGINPLADNELTVTIIFKALLTSNSHCSYSDAFKEFDDNFHRSMADFTWIQLLSNLGLDDKTIGAVVGDVSTTPFGEISFISTLDHACSSAPTSSPVKGSGNTNSIGAKEDAHTGGSENEYFGFYLFCLVSFSIVTASYLLYVTPSKVSNEPQTTEKEKKRTGDNFRYIQYLKKEDQHEALMYYNEKTDDFEPIDDNIPGTAINWINDDMDGTVNDFTSIHMDGGEETIQSAVDGFNKKQKHRGTLNLVSLSTDKDKTSSESDTTALNRHSSDVAYIARSETSVSKKKKVQGRLNLVSLKVAAAESK